MPARTERREGFGVPRYRFFVRPRLLWPPFAHIEFLPLKSCTFGGGCRVFREGLRAQSPPLSLKFRGFFFLGYGGC